LPNVKASSLHCLQQLPEPALPQVSVHRRQGMARRRRNDNRALALAERIGTWHPSIHRAKSRLSTSSRQRSNTRSRQLTDQHLCLFQIGGLEAFGEPAVDRRDEVAGFDAPAPSAAEAGEAHGGAQPPELGLQLLGDAQGVVIQFRIGFGMPLSTIDVSSTTRRLQARGSSALCRKLP
jgi:hypothetical protein